MTTPRSGSTLFCDQLRLAGGPVAHEYFQPQRYLPLAADRWGAITSERVIDRRAFVDALIRHRTDSSGRLAINLHGSHAPTFMQFWSYFPAVPVRAVRIARRDRTAQAISWLLAQQTNKWTSNYEGVAPAQYSFKKVRARVEDLAYQETVLDALCATLDVAPKLLVYEDFAPESINAANEWLGVVADGAGSTEGMITRQRDAVNEEWLQRYRDDSLVAASSTNQVRRLAARLRRSRQRARAVV